MFLLLRFATYGVLLAAAVIFIEIGWKGGRVVFRAEAPFLNVPFLTQAPESLHVLKLPDGTTRKLGDREYRAFYEALPDQV